jgi:AraC family transcriptional regulator, regulatory protein of adaptative response / methylated-DNA-[protein]-cysteine methyltransferase
VTPFLTRDTWLGRLLVARSEKGLCWVSLGEDDEALEGELRAAFPDASEEAHDKRLVEWAGAIVEHLEGARPELELPLDVGGSLFQRQVWWALRAIPYGRTRTYGEIARSLGSGVAPRAVARACAANTLAVVIPCHRAIGQDGDLTGYRWGLGRKRLLLERERQVLGEPTQMTLL